MTTRSACASDLAAVAGMHETARLSYYRDGGHEPDPTRVMGVDGWKDYFDRPHCRIVVAEISPGTGAHTVGFLCQEELFDDEPVLELTALYVHPTSWSRGVGSVLHALFVSSLAASGARVGILEVWAGNERARAFYSARGWRVTGSERPGPIDLPFLEMVLDG